MKGILLLLYVACVLAFVSGRISFREEWLSGLSEVENREVLRIEKMPPVRTQRIVSEEKLKKYRRNPCSRPISSKSPVYGWQEMKITAYDPLDPGSVSKKWRDGKTSTGKNALVLDGVAADPELLPPGTKVFIPGIGEKVVDDTGRDMCAAAMEGRYHIDLRMSSKKEADRFGVKRLMVRVIGPSEAIVN